MEDMDNLTKDQKSALISLFAAVMEEMENKDTEEIRVRILEDMMEHDEDLENYALFGYLTTIILRDVADSMMKDKENEKNNEYKIIG